MTIRKKQDQLIEKFNALGDCFEQYTYLIALSAKLQPMVDSDRTEDNLVKGCQSKVWLKIRLNDGIITISADSDTLIIKGVLYILIDLLSGCTPSEIELYELDFLEKTQLAETFASDRLNGISSIVTTIKKHVCCIH